MFNLEKRDDEKLQAAFDKAMKELNVFYEIDWVKNLPRVFIVKNRATIEALWEQKSEPWQIGWSSSSGIYLLDQDMMTQESSHKRYNDEQYATFIKHELSHSFSRVITKVGNKEILPKWIWEGLPVYTSDEYKMHEIPKEFSSFLKYYTQHDKNIYAESGYVVKLLVDVFGKDKLLNLLKRLREATSEQGFAKLFAEIYGIELSYESINKLLKQTPGFI